jgi:hypothetical protein
MKKFPHITIKPNSDTWGWDIVVPVKKQFFKINKTTILINDTRIQLFGDELYIGTNLGQRTYIINELYMIDNSKSFGIFNGDDCVLCIVMTQIRINVLTLTLIKDDYWKTRKWFLKLFNEIQND